MPRMALINQSASAIPIKTNNPMKTFVGILSISFNAIKIINGIKHTIPPPFVGKTRTMNKIIPKPKRVRLLTGLGSELPEPLLTMTVCFKETA